MENKLAYIKSSAKRVIVIMLALSFCIETLTFAYGIVFLGGIELPSWYVGLLVIKCMIIGGYVGVSWWEEYKRPLGG